MASQYPKEKKVAIAAVLKASELARKMQGTLEALDVINKEDLSPVTITDFSCQALINKHLMEAFPDDPIMGEEDSLTLIQPENLLVKKKVVEQIGPLFPGIEENEILEAIDRGGHQGGPKGRFWVLDPIDGTRGFIHKEQYAVALALIENGEVVLGVLSCPRLHYNKQHKGVLFCAVKNEGCTAFCLDTGEEKIANVKTQLNPKDVIYCEPHGTSKTHSHSDAFKIAKILGAYPKPFRLDSQCKYAVVANGQAGIYLRLPNSANYLEKIWDHAPGVLIVQEAGGKVTDAYGQPLDFTQGTALTKNYGVIATNGFLHAQVLKAAAQILGEKN